jgi:chromosome segregation ATPase
MKLCGSKRREFLLVFFFSVISFHFYFRPGIYAQEERPSRQINGQEENQKSEANKLTSENLKAVQQNIESVRGDVKLLKSDIVNLGRKIEEFDVAVQNFQSSLSQIESEIDSLKSKINEIENELASIKGDRTLNIVNELRKEIEDIKLSIMVIYGALIFIFIVFLISIISRRQTRRRQKLLRL